MLMGKNGFYFLNMHFNFELSSKTFADFHCSSSYTLAHEHADPHEHTTQPQRFSPMRLHNNQSASLMLNLYILLWEMLWECVYEYLSKTGNEIVHGVPDHIIACMLHQFWLWRPDHLTMEVLRRTVEFRGTVTAGLY